MEITENEYKKQLEKDVAERQAANRCMPYVGSAYFNKKINEKSSKWRSEPDYLNNIEYW